MKGHKITLLNKTLIVPDDPIIPFIEGDGTGPDIWAASVKVFDAAVEKAYQGKRKIIGRRYWPEKRLMIRQETGCLKKPCRLSENALLPSKGPLTTPVGGGIRSLNVALRQILGSVCLSPPGQILRRCSFTG